MASIETASTVAVDVHTHPSLRWGAVIAGWMVAGGIALLLYIAGIALGFHMFDPYDTSGTAKGLGIGTAVWMVLTWAVSLFLGGMFASWFDGRDDQTTGCLHGVTVWGLSLAMATTLLALGLSGAAVGGGALLGGSAAGMHGSDNGHGAHAIAGSDAMVRLQAQIAQRLGTAPGAAANGGAQAMASNGRAQGDQGAAAMIATALLADHPDTASALFQANTGMDSAQANGAVQSLTPQVTQAKADLKAAADKTAHYAALAMWTVFLSLLLALLAAAAGGWLGAGQVHRVYHLRRYPSSVPR
jgi:hypothetical protein